MKKIFSYMLASVLPVAACAASLTPEEALQRAMPMMRKVASKEKSTATLLSVTDIAGTGVPAVYVFGYSGDEGYLVLSADDVAAPVLGYADSGRFDAGNMSPQMRYWLDEYARQIEYARENGLRYTSASRSVGDPIEPMIKTKWGQTAPYNNTCPLDGGKRSVTGCVATALAQVMNYWQYPERGTGWDAARVRDVPVDSIDLGEIAFDWENMTDTYTQSSTPEERAAVAELMRACGYAIHMNYSNVESGSTTNDLISGLASHFGYNSSMTVLQRNRYTIPEWERVIYTELEEGRPVLYSGRTLTGGHQFVCDGYDGAGFFHINWGWDGMSDGYFALSVLDPGLQGTGGSISGFKFDQDIVQGVQKTTVPRTLSSMALSNSGVEGSIQQPWVIASLGEEAFFYNCGALPIANSFAGMMLTSVGGDRKICFRSWQIGYDESPLLVGWGYGSNSLVFEFPMNEPDGLYKAQLAYMSGDTGEWFPVPATLGYSSYFYVEKKDGVLSVRNVGFQSFDLEGNYEGEICKGKPVSFSITATNPTDRELTQSICASLSDDSGIRYAAEGPVVTLAPGEETTLEWSSTFILEYLKSDITEDTEFTFCFYNRDNGVPYGDGEKVTMHLNSGIGLTSADSDNIPVEYFNMQGVRVDGESLLPGLYVWRRGGTTGKIEIK